MDLLPSALRDAWIRTLKLPMHFLLGRLELAVKPLHTRHGRDW